MASLFSKGQTSLLCVLNDLEEAGYFYHDLCQLTGGDQICFFPSAYRRDIKYGHIDSANEILRTEALNLLQEPDRPFMLVSYPEALAERVVSQAVLQQNTLRIHQGDRLDHQFVCDVLHSYGFQLVDYVYEPGQFAIRGSIIDVFSYSYEFPYRIDFFGDEIESIRSFNVETQLSKEKLETIYIVPEMRNDSQKSASLLASLPDSTLLVTRDLAWCQERIGAIWNEEPVQADEDSFADADQMRRKLVQADDFLHEALRFRRIHIGAKAFGVADATIAFPCRMQPVCHKNFDLVSESFHRFLDESYSLYILSDTEKQTDRIRTIFADRGDPIPFTKDSPTTP